MLLAVESWPGFLIHDDEGDVFTVDPDNEMALEYIDTTPEVLSDMAFSPEGGLYGATLPWWGGVSALYSFVADFEAATPSITAEWVRTITRGVSGWVYVNSLGFNSAGELFAVGSKSPNPHINPNFLFKIDLDTAEAEEILSLGGYASAGDLMFDSHDNMYLTTVSEQLLRVPPEQDSFEVVGPTGVDDFYGITLGPGPISYGFTWSEKAYQIDTATGDSTLLAQFDHPWLDYINGAATVFPAPTDLGEVDFQELPDQQPTLGELWYQVEAVRDGVLTVEVTDVDPAAEFDVTLYELDGSGNLDELETGLLRVDYEDATAGDVYYAQIANADSNFGLRVANLVQTQGVGNGAVVYGTDGDDTFTFTPGPPYLFTINDVNYSYNFRSTSTVVVSFDGGIGHDVAEIFGSSSSDTATLNLGTSSGTVTRPSRYRVELAGTPEISFDGVDGVDSATLIGSDLADTIVLQPTWGTVTQSTSSLEVTDVENISVDGGAGDDTATFTGTTSDETAELGYLSADFAPAAGTSFSVGVTNVETISAEAGGGYDTASFADSSQQDTFEATPQWASLAGTGFSLLANGYDQVRAESTHGGNDVALLRGQAGSQDIFKATPAYGKLSGTGFDNQASSFRYLHGYGNTGDLDVALLYGDPGAQDTFRAWAGQAVLSGNGYYNRARSFRYAHGYSNAGDNDLALMYDSPTSNDTFQAWPTMARIFGPGFYYRVKSFRYVHGYGTTGNQDVALLYGDPAQQNTYRAWPQQAVLSGANPAIDGHTDSDAFSGMSQVSAARPSRSASLALAGRLESGGRSETFSRRHFGPFRPRISRMRASTSDTFAGST